MRHLTEYNPGNFVPTESELVTIKSRQREVIEYCRFSIKSKGFDLHTSIDVRNSMGGVAYVRILMLAKAAMINKGRNVLNHWTYFKAEILIPWRIHYWESDELQWGSMGTRMESTFVRTDTRGNLISKGLWTPELVRDIDRFGIIEDANVLYWIGEIGGELPHEAHPENTLIVFPRTETVAVDKVISIGADVIFGKPPYILTLGVDRPSWVTLNNLINEVRITPTRLVILGDYIVSLIITDALMQEALADLTIKVVA